MKTPRNTTIAIAIATAIMTLALASLTPAQQAPPPLPGTYYLAKDPDLPPLPFNPFPQLPSGEVAPGVFVVDDTNMPDTPEQAAARAARQAAQERAAQIDPKAAAEAAAKEREARMAERRAALAPFMVKPIADQNGEPRTAAAFRAAKRQWLAERVAQQKRELADKKARLDRLKREKGWQDRIRLDSGSDAVLIGERNGSPLYYAPHNINAADTISTDEVWPGGATGFDLNGANTVIGLWDQDAVRDTHVEFNSRVIQQDGATLFDFHATATAGTLMSAGINTLNVGGQIVPNAARGMSFAADLDAYSFDDDLIEMPDEVLNDDLRLSNHSYGLTSGWFLSAQFGWMWFGQTTISAQEDFKFGFYLAGFSDTLDQIVYDGETYLPVFSSGNDQGDGPATQPVNHWALVGQDFQFFTGVTRNIDGGANGFDTVSPQGSAKNVLTVGAVDDIIGGWNGVGSVDLADFSSMGPTDDGRIKPDLVANGIALVTTDEDSDTAYQIISGTSFSAPNVTGSLNLLRQLYHATYTEDYPMLASALKAVAIHTADEAGSVGPDYSHGWGLMNTATGAELLAADTASDSHPHIKEVFMPNGGTITFPVTTDGNAPLRVTICWTDPPGIAPAEAVDPAALMLRNDLDLRVTSPSSVVHQPWVLNPANPAAAATTGDNTRDNVEQVVINAPSAGVYTVTVTHKGTLVDGAQTVSIVIDGNIAQAAPTHQITSFVQTGTDEFTIVWPTVVGANYQIQSTTDFSQWSDAGGEISPLTTTTAVVLTGGAPHKFYRIIRLR
ncbi:MAG: S8 family serine peptidase [Verrucomicrobia bacterium]|nr:S8 family serine peptidase [Verrucomicrobiota bacterium]